MSLTPSAISRSALMHKLFSGALLGLLACGMLGCASMPSSMISSTSPLPPGVRGTIPTKGTDCQYFLLGIIPFTSSPDTQSALNDAKSNARVDVLTDVTVDHNAGYYLLFSNHCVRVEGLGVPREVLASHATGVVQVP